MYLASASGHEKDTPRYAHKSAVLRYGSLGQWHDEYINWSRIPEDAKRGIQKMTIWMKGELVSWAKREGNTHEVQCRYCRRSLFRHPQAPLIMTLCPRCLATPYCSEECCLRDELMHHIACSIHPAWKVTTYASLSNPFHQRIRAEDLRDEDLQANRAIGGLSLIHI